MSHIPPANTHLHATRFGYVPASIVSLGWLLVWQTLLVGRARSRAAIPYPQCAYNTPELASARSLDVIRLVYAEQAQVKASPLAMQFNCTQRSLSRVLPSLQHTHLSSPPRSPSEHSRGCAHYYPIVSSCSPSCFPLHSCVAQHAGFRLKVPSCCRLDVWLVRCRTLHLYHWLQIWKSSSRTQIGYATCPLAYKP